MSVSAHALPPRGDDALGPKPPAGTRQRLRQEAFNRVRLEPDGSVPPEARVRAIQALRAAPVSVIQRGMGTVYTPQSGGLQSQKVTNPWTFLGPRPIKDDYQNGGAGIYGFGNASVKINAIAVSTGGDTVLLGSFGGIAKSTDGGVNWRYVSDGLPSQSIFSLAMDSTAPNIIYAGTGDDSFGGTSNTSLMSVGVYRSTDGGETWGRFASSNLTDRAIYKILVDPATSGSQTGTTLWLAARQGNNTGGGIFKSVDSGQTWTEKLTGSAYDLAIDTTTTPHTLFAARLTNGLYKSVDAGENWTDISGLGPNNPNTNKNSVGAAGGVIYYSNTDGTYNNSFGNPVNGRVYKSTNAGASWTEVTAAQGFCGGQCFYDQYVEPNPYDPNMVIFGGVDPSSSANAGATVVDFAPFAGGPIIHSDQHSVAFVNATTVYIGNDGGVYKTVNGGRTWLNLNANLAGGLFIGISASGDGGMIAGLQDNGSVARFAGETDWRVVRGGDGGYNEVDPGNSAKSYTMYVTVGNVVASLIQRSLDGGASAVQVTPAAAVGAETANFYSPFFMDPENGARILWGAQNLYRSVNSGDSWTRIGDIKTMTGGTNIAAIAEAPSSGQVIYVGLSDYTVLVTSDADNGNAATWSNRSAGLPNNQFPTAFAVHPATPAVAFVSYSHYGPAGTPRLHVFKTTDTGQSWVGVSSGIPDVPVIDIVIDTQAPNNLFAATDVGVFNSIDGAKTWTRSDIGMPEGLIASALSLNMGTRKLTAGTYGRGAYQLDLPQPPPIPSGAGGVALGRSSATLTWSASAGQYNVQAYGVYYSTDPTVLIGSVTVPSLTLTGLAPNTTVAFEVTAANGVLESANSTAAYVATLASAPTGITAAVFLTSATLTVSIDAGNPADTQYDRQVSTNAFTSVLVTSRTFGEGAAPLTGLSANTTYYFRARAINRAGLPSGYSGTTIEATLAAVPSSAAASGISSTSITANWGANGNGDLTPYLIEISTNGFASVSASEVLMALTRTFSGLSASTSYYFRVSAFSHRGGVWTSTTALPMAVTSETPPSTGTISAAAFTSISTDAITSNWTSSYPGGTTYYASVSTDNFSTVNATSVTYGVYASAYGLGPNATYYFRVSTQAAGPFTNLGSTSTLAWPPTSAAVVPLGLSSVTLSWSGGLNPGGTLYEAVLSVSSGMSPVAASSRTANGSASFTGLAPNTTWFLSVRALNRAGAATAATAAVSTATFVAAPSSGSLGGVSASAITLAWGASGNPSDTLYEAAVSTEASMDSTLASTFTLSISAVFTGLAANTTYYLAAQALGRSGAASDPLPLLATSTLVNLPASSATVVSGLSVTGYWGANGNGPATPYELQLSSDGFASTLASSQTLVTQATFSSLDSGTTYYLRVRAFGHHHGQWTATVALSSAVTPTTPTLTAGAYSAVAVDGFRASWGSGFAAGTTYYAAISTDNFATVNGTSVTLNTFGDVTGLQTNTTYYARVSTDAAGPFTSLGSTSTLAAAPVFSAAYALGASSAAVTWGVSGNPAGTIFEARVRTEALALWASSRTASSTATFTALTPNATWFLDVRALSRAGAATVYTSTGVVLTPPVAPGTVTASVGLSSAVVSFSAGGNAAGTVFVVAASTGAGMSTLASTAAVAATSATLSGLALNTSYYFAAQARGFGGSNADSAVSGPFATLAADPVYSSATVGVSSIVFSWSANGNPAGTNFFLQVSSDAFATINESGYDTETSVELAGLASNTTYYLRLRAVNHGGVANAYVTSATGTWTYAAIPGAAAPSAVSTAALTASWTANGNSAVTVYTAQLSTDNFTSVAASSVTRLTAAVFSGLSANATYYTRVRAAGFGGDVTAFTTLPTTMTLLSSPGLAGASFTAVSSVSLTAQWTTGGNGAGTLYNTLLSTDNFATTAASSDTFNPYATFAGLTPNTTYYTKVRAASGGNVSAYLTLGSTSTAVNAPTSAAVSASSQTTVTLGWAANGNAAGTWYTAQASSNSFASVLASSLTLGTSATFTGLAANTTYYLRVRAEGWSSVPSAYATAAATATHPAAPVSLASLNTQVDFILAGWGTGGNPAGTIYTLAASTNPSLLPVAASASTTSTSVTVSTLAANTSHYLAVTAAGHNGTVSAPALLGPLSTRPDDVLVAINAVSQSSLTFTITPQRNPAGTTYRLTFSTDSYATTVLVADTTQTAVSQTGLTPNTTYQFRVQPIGAGGSATASLLSTVTYAAAPVAAAPTAVSTAALTANWLSGGNAVGTLYRAQVSTDAFTTVNASSLTFGVSALFSGLSANTTYYTRVRAEGHNGTPSAYATLPSTTTPLLSPAAAGTTFTTIGFTSVTVAWASGGNGAGTTYIAELSTDNFATVNAASSTLNLYALYGTGGFGPALLPATTYYARVRSTNGVNSSANVVLGSTATLSYPPSGSVVLSVTSTTVVLDWQANGNPEPGTQYQLWRDVAAGFTAPTVTVVSTSGATAAGLAASTSYYFKVRALTAAGYASAFDAAVSTGTLPPTPGQPGTPSGTALGVSSISWSWTASANSPSFYKVYAASNPVALVASTVPAAFVQSALAVNTAYGVRVAGVNASGEGTLSAAATVYTLAAPPAGTTLVAAYGSSATLSWSLNGNPAATVAEVYASTTSGVFASSPTVTSTQTHTEYGLIGCTTYYLKVRNRNGDARLTAFDTTVQFLTAASTPAAPIGLTADSVAGNRVQLTWTPSPTEGVTGYRLYYDNGSGVVSYAAPLAVLTSTETAFTTGVLLSSAAYNFALRARHRCGVEETSGVFAAAASVGALASVRAQIKTPDSGKRIKGNRVSIVAELTSGSPYQVSSVTFQTRLQGSPAWTTIVPPDAALHPNPDLVAPYFVHWDVNSIANGTYELRAVAYNVAGTSDTAPAVTVVSVVGAGATDFDISEGTALDASGNTAIKKEQVVNTAVVNTVLASGDSATDPSVKVQLPAGALTGSTVTVSVIANPTIPSTSAPSGFTLAGSAISIDLSNGQTALNGSAVLTLSYPDTVVFGSGQELDIQSYDPLTGTWSDIGATTVDATNRTATASTPHFSIFAIIVGAGAQSDLARVRVYPVPYKPNSGNPNEGKPYSAGDATSGIIFDRLPAMVKLQIYTLSGRLVAEFETAAGTGTIQWDVRNADGRDVASGGYFAVISSPGHKSVVKKLAVIR